MIVFVSDSSIELRQPDDFKGFHVEAADGLDVGRLLAAGSAGGPADGADVYVSIDWLRGAASTLGVGADWPDQLAGMVTYAGSKGWLDEAGGAIRAHIERV